MKAGELTAARVAAYRTVARTFGEGAYADKVFRVEAERSQLDGRDRAFAQRLAYGTIQGRATLDYVITALSARPVDTIDAPLLNALRLGVQQLIAFDTVPDHAAVGQTVELAKRHGRGGHTFVNAVMRRATREAVDLVSELSDETAAGAAVRHSHPEWLVRMWWDALGREDTLALLERDNAPAENALRANELLVTRSEVEERLAEGGVEARPAEDLPEGFVVDGQFDAHGSQLFESGAITPQARGSMLVARALRPEPGQRVLDMCAAPGAKTTHLAALMGDRGELVALERNGGRARVLEENCERVDATCVSVREIDAALFEDGRGFDAVLLDPPCSDLGTLQARPDVRWKKEEGAPTELAAVQARLLESAAGHVTRGGALVYSTCTISPRENEGQIATFLERHDEFEADSLAERLPAYAQSGGNGFLQVLPHRHGTDGFFMARLRRTS